MLNFSKALFIGAHFDDVDLACFGTMAKFKKHGVNVFKLTITDNVTHTDNFSVDYDSTRIQSKKVCDLIGVVQLKFNVFPCSQLTCGQKEMQAVELIINNLQPDIIFTHHPHDVNLDHIAASSIVTTAARHIKNLVYFKSNMYFNPSFNQNLFYDISEFSQLKKEALNTYSVQHNRKNRLFNHANMRDELCADNFDVTAVESFQALRLYA